MIERRSFRLTLSVLAVCVAAASCSGGDDSGGSGETIATRNNQELLTAADMMIGAPDAPVTIIEYASVTCPGCAAFHTRIFPIIKEKYIDTGKVRFVFREFPTPPANLSMAGFVMARCIADRSPEKAGEAYFGVVGTLFHSQGQWLYGDNPSPKDEFLKIAGEAGMTEVDLNACLSDEENVDTISEIIETGRTKYEITGTPSFVIDGVKRQDVRALNDFEKVIEERLAAKG